MVVVELMEMTRRPVETLPTRDLALPVLPEGIRGVEVRRSARRTRTVQARVEDGLAIVMLPMGLSAAQEQDHIESLVSKLARRARRGWSDEELTRRAAQVAALRLDGATNTRIRPSAVRWVTTMNHRWGSCSTDTGEIRLSHRLRGMPGWVTDHVLYHELIHLHEANHGPRFQQLLDLDPERARAEAYLAGWTAGHAWVDQD